MGGRLTVRVIAPVTLLHSASAWLGEGDQSQLSRFGRLVPARNLYYFLHLRVDASSETVHSECLSLMVQNGNRHKPEADRHPAFRGSTLLKRAAEHPGWPSGVSAFG